MITMERKVEIPDDVEVEIEGSEVTVSNENNKVVEDLDHPLLNIRKEGGNVVIELLKDNKKVDSISRTFKSKIRNAIKGVKEGFEYKLKIIYRHFPMEVRSQGNKLVVSNFLGEKEDREAKILDGVNVEVSEEEITVSGPDKEKVGQTAANIEGKMQAPTSKDRRVFEDGIYIVEKPGVEA